MVIIENNGNLERLRKILFEAFPEENNEAVGGARFYQANGPTWHALAFNYLGLPTQSEELFVLKEEAEQKYNDLDTLKLNAEKRSRLELLHYMFKRFMDNVEELDVNTAIIFTTPMVDALLMATHQLETNIATKAIAELKIKPLKDNSK